MVVKAGYDKKNESKINAVEMRLLHSMCGVSRKERCRNSDVRKRCSLKEDVMTRVERAPSNHGGGEITERACYESLERLGLEYIDLYLIHWPGAGSIPAADKRNAELRDSTWGTLVDIYKEGRFKAIGVSNYTERHLKELMAKDYGVSPAVNQVEWHPFYYQPELLKYSQDNDIVLQAYCSLGGTSVNDKSLLNHPTVVNIANKLNVANGQVLLAWALQQGVAIIPKASSVTHIKNNINLNFKIPEEDVIQLNKLSINKKKYAWDPNTVY
ncbi:9,11-endoperoxide prostaglandin H2 reductase [Eumeta japonica]|uniref:9,11-endoperoxide prostaglandin H2 reductase n=1 Tax=Eumeta variegata TaxID=151549 RepID=A0A4C1ZHL3_EUMVA|nr:9,11-endoperoxide prostaglandin H2 reductase [Eumeta japonica]